jgi:hypothetical protein
MVLLVRSVRTTRSRIIVLKLMKNIAPGSNRILEPMFEGKNPEFNTVIRELFAARF